jgi:hypothetical protein
MTKVFNFQEPCIVGLNITKLAQCIAIPIKGFPTIPNACISKGHHDFGDLKVTN